MNVHSSCVFELYGLGRQQRRRRVTLPPSGAKHVELAMLGKYHQYLTSIISAACRMIEIFDYRG